MEVVNAEVLFNYLGKRYEDAYANSPNLKSVIQDVLANLKPGSSVLDVGCGTGKPVAAMIASAGHSVYGIDVADEMVRISRSQVQGRFEKADLRSFNPSQNFDAIFVIFSLYQISPSETHAAAYRFARWLRDDGVLVLGTTSGSSINLNRPGLLDDKIWGCIRWLNKTWMTKTTNETFLSEEGWRSLLNSAGFTIESEKLFKFLPEDNEYKVPENHFIVVARKTIQTNPLFGPYPLRTPNKARPTRDETVWKEFQQRVEFENGHSVIVDVLKSGTKILDIGDGLRCLWLVFFAIIGMLLPLLTFHDTCQVFGRIQSILQRK